MKAIATIILLSLLCSAAYAMSHPDSLVIQHRKKERRIVLYEGEKVKIKTVHNQKYKGPLQIYNQDKIILKADTIPLQEVQVIKTYRDRKNMQNVGNGTGIVLFGTGGILGIMGAFLSLLMEEDDDIFLIEVYNAILLILMAIIIGVGLVFMLIGLMFAGIFSGLSKVIPQSFSRKRWNFFIPGHQSTHDL